MEVVICGGGVIGCSIAYYLSLRGVNSTIIESNAIACGASGKAGGFLAKDWNDHSPLGPLSRKSFQLHHELAQTLPTEYGFRSVDTVSVSTRRKTSKKTHGLPNWLDGKAISSSKELGTCSTGCQVHPELFTKALLEAASGVRIKYGIVDRLAIEGSKVSGVYLQDNGELVPATHVIIAMGPWSNKMKAEIRNFPEITTQRAHSIVLRPTTNVSAHVVFAEGNRSGPDPEIVPRPDGTVYVCGCTDDQDLPDRSQDVECLPGSGKLLHEASGQLSSVLGQAECQVVQACYLPYTSDGLPVIGALNQAEGMYIATGHGCWGILNAPVTGLLLSELIVDGEIMSVDASAFSPNRFNFQN